MSVKAWFIQLVRECNKRFEYIPDPPGFDYAKTPAEFEADGGGDCEDGQFWIASKLGHFPVEDGTLYCCIGWVPVLVTPENPKGVGRHAWLEFEDRLSRIVGDWTSGWANGLPEGWQRTERFPWVGDHWEKD